MKEGVPGWRGPELNQWANYILNGGLVYPVDFLDWYSTDELP